MKAPGHRVEIEFEGGFTSGKLICPPEGCAPGNCECGRPLDGHADEQRAADGLRPCAQCEDYTPKADECWVASWFDNCGLKLLKGKLVADVESIENDGGDGITIEIGRQAELDAAIELRRCMDSMRGSLTAIVERLPPGAESASLDGLLEGGIPAVLDLVDGLVGDLGGPARTEDERLAKSFFRGYQVTDVLRRESAGIDCTDALKQDPEEFVKQAWARRDAVLDARKGS